MTDKAEVILLRDSANEKNDPSLAFLYLHNERGELAKTKSVLFKYACYIIPIVKSWAVAEKEVVGAIILSNMSKIVQGSEQNRNGIIGGNFSIIIRDFFQQVSNAFNLSYLEITNMKLAASYSSLREVSKCRLSHSELVPYLQRHQTNVVHFEIRSC